MQIRHVKPRRLTKLRQQVVSNNKPTGVALATAGTTPTPRQSSCPRSSRPGSSPRKLALRPASPPDRSPPHPDPPPPSSTPQPETHIALYSSLHTQSAVSTVA